MSKNDYFSSQQQARSKGQNQEDQATCINNKNNLSSCGKIHNLNKQEYEEGPQNYPQQKKVAAPSKQQAQNQKEKNLSHDNPLNLANMKQLQSAIDYKKPQILTWQSVQEYGSFQNAQFDQKTTQDQELARLRIQINNLSEQYKKLQVKLESEMKRSSQLNNSCQKVQIQSKKLKQEVQTYKKKLKEVQLNYTNTKQRQLNYEIVIRQLQAQLNLLKNQLYEKTETIQSLTDSKMEYQNTIDALNQQFCKNYKNSFKNHTKSVAKCQQIQAKEKRLPHHSIEKEGQAKQLLQTVPLANKVQSKDQTQTQAEQVQKLSDLVQSKQLQDFKVRQQSQFSNLISIFKTNFAQDHKKSVQQFRQTMLAQYKKLEQRIEANAAENQQQMNQLAFETKKEIQQINQACSNVIQDDYPYIVILTSDKRKLQEQLAEIQYQVTILLNNCFNTISRYSEQNQKIQQVHNQEQDGWDCQRQQLLRNLCQFTKNTAKLQNQLQIALITQIKSRSQCQYQIQLYKHQVQTLGWEFAQMKAEKQVQIVHLKAQLECLEDQLKTSKQNALTRQSCIINTISSQFTSNQQEKQKYDSLVDQNKVDLVQLRQHFVHISGQLIQHKEEQKNSIISYYIQRYGQLSKQFQSYKMDTYQKIQTLNDQKSELQAQIQQTHRKETLNLCIQSKSKEAGHEILSFILEKLSLKNEKLSWRDVINCFLDYDTDGAYRDLTNLLTISCDRFLESQQMFTQMESDLKQRTKQLQRLQLQIIQYKTDYLNQNYLTQRKEAELQSIRGRLQNLLSQNESLRQQNQKIKGENEYNKQLLQQSSKKIAQLALSRKQIQGQRISKTHQQIIKQKQTAKNQIIENQRDQQYKKIIARLNKQLEQQRQLIQHYKIQVEIAQKRGLSLKEDLEAQLEKGKQNLIQSERNATVMQEKIQKLRNQIKGKDQEMQIIRQKLESQKQLIKQSAHQQVVKPIDFSRQQQDKNRGNVRSPLKLQVIDIPSKSIMPDIQNKQPRVFNESSILVTTGNQVQLKQMIQKFTKKQLLAAELKFKMQPNKLDYSSDVKDINLTNFAWIFKKQEQIFGAVSFNRQTTEQQTAILFNLTKSIVIQPASLKSSWNPIKTDSFYLTFGVQQAKYIWKSKIFSITDSKSSLKYFDHSKPLVPSLLSAEKMEVEQFQVYCLNF